MDGTAPYTTLIAMYTLIHTILSMDFLSVA
jgi:hypothetical protein